MWKDLPLPLGPMQKKLALSVIFTLPSLPVMSMQGGQRGVLRMLQVLLVKEAQGGIAQRQEQIVVRIERVGTTRETGHP